MPAYHFSTMQIYVLRHTKVDYPSGICYGQLDVPLADTFTRECNTYRNALPSEFDAVFSSPLSRCLALANELNNYKVVTDDRLLEMDFGEWEGKKWDDLEQKKLHKWMKNVVEIKPPKGENLNEVFQRTCSFLAEIRKMNCDKIMIVTHAGIIRCIWAYLLEIDIKNCFRIPVGYGEVLVANLGENNNDDFIIQKN